MRKLSWTPILLVLLLLLITLNAGCDRESPVQPAASQLSAGKSIPVSVADFAVFHNTEVERLVQLDRNTHCLSENFQRNYNTLSQELQQRGTLEIHRQAGDQRGAELVPVLLRLNARGNRPLEISSLLQRCLNDFQERQSTHPDIQAGLENCLHLLMAGDTSRLTGRLNDLVLLTDQVGSRAEKCVVGVFSGSFQRSGQARYEDPDVPWYWPYITIYDVIGSLFGGPNTSVLYSSWAEVMFRELFGFMYPPY